MMGDEAKKQWKRDLTSAAAGDLCGTERNDERFFFEGVEAAFLKIS